MPIEPFGPDYTQPTPDCPHCGCCTADLCRHSQEVGWGCEHHAGDDTELRKRMEKCPCSAYYAGPLTLRDSDGHDHQATVFLMATSIGYADGVIHDPTTVAIGPCTLTWPNGAVRRGRVEAPEDGWDEPGLIVTADLDNPRAPWWPSHEK